MKKSVKFTLYSDPGHGWVKVSKKFLRELGIIDKISSFSYEFGESVYLEEDEDAGTFLKAYIESFGKKPEIGTHFANRSSKIRNYNSFNKGEKNA